MGIFKSLFGKSSDDPYSGLSVAAIQQKIAEQNAQIAELRRRLPEGSAMESMEKSAAWMTEMQIKLKIAETKGNLEEAKRLEAEIKEASKKNDRIVRHIAELKDQILRSEDEIELLERALSSAK